MPAWGDAPVKGRGVELKTGFGSVADRAGSLAGGHAVQIARTHEVQKLDRAREAELQAQRKKEQQTRPVENVHSLEAMLARAREEFTKPADLAQLRAASDRVAGQVADAVDRPGWRLPDQEDDNAVRLGLRLNQAVDGVESDLKGLRKLGEQGVPGASRLILNIREVFQYIRGKYPDVPLGVATGYVMKEFAAELGAFHVPGAQMSRAADNVRYLRAMAGVALTRLILKGIQEPVARLFAQGEGR
ncbi:hypothetical protein P5705_14190 [Pseudomonas entomophila]|uniref:hypothetical protein n=1 Tax=Pseudomonas entomophila TaxID=312306 RepID=UPI002405185A|nr:hypothetical protein [Pseudomonas entomophila]MDF9618798.1 hypothetical protein [Pseudomonas entomophila]